MRRFRLEIVLAIILGALAAAVGRWQSPERTLRPADVDAYIGRIAPAIPLADEERTQVLAHLRAWGGSDDGKPVYMLNLMRYYESARRIPGHPEVTGSPRDLNARYEGAAMPLLFGLGAYPMFAGEPEGVIGGSAASTNLLSFDPELENWSRVLVVRYPDRRSFFELLSDPDYLAVMPNKLAALKVMLMPMHEQVSFPDIGRLTPAVLAMLWLLVAAWRSGRRARES